METLQVLSPSHTLCVCSSSSSSSFVSSSASFIYSRYVVHCPFTCWQLVTCSHILKYPFSYTLSLSYSSFWRWVFRPINHFSLLFIHCLWAYLNELPLNIKSSILTLIKAQMNLHARAHAAHIHSLTHSQYLKSLNVILWVWECKYLVYARTAQKE